VSIDDIFRYAATGLLAFVGVYLVARAASAAFFKSKRDHERMVNNGTSKHEPR